MVVGRLAGLEPAPAVLRDFAENSGAYYSTQNRLKYCNGPVADTAGQIRTS